MRPPTGPYPEASARRSPGSGGPNIRVLEHQSLHWAPIVAHGGKAKGIFMPNGVHAEAFTGELGPPPTGLEWLEATPTFVYPGAHGPANGLDLVLQAAADLQRRGRDDIRVLLIGDGPVKTDLRREAERLQLNNVVFHDPVPKQAIPSILRRCAGGLMVLKDVELFRFGVSPNKLFDYLACDLPVLTDVPGDVAGTVERAEAGIVVPPGDPEVLADGMIAIADGGDRVGSGIAYVREHHDRRMLADRLAKVIDAVAWPSWLTPVRPTTVAKVRAKMRRSSQKLRSSK